MEDGWIETEAQRDRTLRQWELEWLQIQAKECQGWMAVIRLGRGKERFQSLRGHGLTDT